MQPIQTTTAIAAAMLLASCATQNTQTTGFLSDYSRLSKQSDHSYRFISPTMKGYSAIMIAPVSTQLGKVEHQLSAKQIAELKSYTQARTSAAVRNAGKQLVYAPGPNVALLRIAITNVEESGAINALPQAAILGIGSGSATMEAELLDSVTGIQVGAIVETGKGSRIPFANLGDLGTSKGLIDGWASRLQKRLSE